MNVEYRRNGLYCLAAMLPYVALDFGHLSIHQVAIPKALQDMKRGARPSVQKAQTNNIPAKK
jgi:hypothetical protein